MHKVLNINMEGVMGIIEDEHCVSSTAYRLLAYCCYVYSLACNKMVSNQEPLECQETLQSTFLFTKIEIAVAVPQKIS